MHIQYNELEFTHFVVIKSDGTVIGCARENGHVYNFIIRRGVVQAQRGGQWFELEPEPARLIHKKAQDAYTKRPAYRTNRIILD